MSSLVSPDPSIHLPYRLPFDVGTPDRREPEKRKSVPTSTFIGGHSDVPPGPNHDRSQFSV